MCRATQSLIYGYVPVIYGSVTSNIPKSCLLVPYALSYIYPSNRFQLNCNVLCSFQILIFYSLFVSTFATSSIINSLCSLACLLCNLTLCQSVCCFWIFSSLFSPPLPSSIPSISSYSLFFCISTLNNWLCTLPPFSFQSLHLLTGFS